MADSRLDLEMLNSCQSLVCTQVAVVRPTCLLEDDVNPSDGQIEQALVNQGQVCCQNLSNNIYYTTAQTSTMYEQ